MLCVRGFKRRDVPSLSSLVVAEERIRFTEWLTPLVGMWRVCGHCTNHANDLGHVMTYHKFTWKWSLHHCMQVHGGERRHQCTYCQKQFTRSCDLTAHTLSHMGLRPRRRVAASTANCNLEKPSLTKHIPRESSKSSDAMSEVHQTFLCFF